MGISADLIRSESPALLLLLATALVYAGERRVHSYNYDYLTTVEGEELIPAQMKRYYFLVVIFPLIAALLSWVLPEEWSLKALPIPGITLIFLGFVFRTWAMRSLGRLWTQRCIYIPDMPRAANGPYRYLKHPEYIARGLEALGFVLFFGANIITLLLFLRLVMRSVRIAKVESRQIHELSAAPLHLVDGGGTVGASKL